VGHAGQLGYSGSERLQARDSIMIKTHLSTVCSRVLNIDHRVYRHAKTDEEAHLSARAITGPSGPWWEVRLVRADGRPGAVAGQTAIDCWQSQEAARAGYRERLQALQAAGWVWVE